MCSNEMSFEMCMDILDWFDDELFDEVSNDMASGRHTDAAGNYVKEFALPAMRDRAQQLVNSFAGTAVAYPQ